MIVAYLSLQYAYNVYFPVTPGAWQETINEKVYGYSSASSSSYVEIVTAFVGFFAFPIEFSLKTDSGVILFPLFLKAFI